LEPPFQLLLQTWLSGEGQLSLSLVVIMAVVVVAVLLFLLAFMMLLRHCAATCCWWCPTDPGLWQCCHLIQSL
jgi:hypothetical protein